MELARRIAEHVKVESAVLDGEIACVDHLILIANDRDTPSPFVSFISTVPSTHLVPGTQIFYPGASGIGQSVWDGKAKRWRPSPTFSHVGISSWLAEVLKCCDSEKRGIIPGWVFEFTS
jgi:hypothetical protein